MARLFDVADQSENGHSAVPSTADQTVPDQAAGSSETEVKEAASAEGETRRVFYSLAPKEVPKETKPVCVPLDSFPGSHSIYSVRELESVRITFPAGADAAHAELFLPGGWDRETSRFNDEAPNSLVLGLDFGTATSKVVIRDETGANDERYAVRFTKNRGIDAYLMPSELWVGSDGHYSLMPGKGGEGQRLPNLKINLMKEPENLIFQERVIAYLALVFRYSWAWMFRERPDIAREGTLWMIYVGAPCGDGDHPMARLCKRLSHFAWVVADQPGVIGSPKIRALMASADAAEAHLARAYFGVIPEVVAETHGFVHDYPVQGKGNYLIVDVGSSTLDTALFYLNKSPLNADTVVEPFDQRVCDLGTATCHQRRVQFLYLHFKRERNRADEKERIPLERILGEIQTRNAHTLRSALPGQITEYWKGLDALRFDAVDVDEEFMLDVADVIFEIRNAARVAQVLTTAELCDLPIVLCGGGARAKIYERALRNMDDRARNRQWAQNRTIMSPLPIKNLYLQEAIADNDHARLLVAAGLSLGEVRYVRENREDRRATGVHQETKAFWTERDFVADLSDRDQCE